MSNLRMQGGWPDRRRGRQCGGPSPGRGGGIDDVAGLIWGEGADTEPSASLMQVRGVRTSSPTVLDQACTLDPCSLPPSPHPRSSWFNLQLLALTWWSKQGRRTILPPLLALVAGLSPESSSSLVAVAGGFIPLACCSPGTALAVQVNQGTYGGRSEL